MLTKPLTALVVSVGVALIITASVRPGTRTRGVVDALGHAGGNLEEAALGEHIV